MFSLGLYSHSPLFLFFFLFFFSLNVNSHCSFRQEMPNGFPKTYSWHGNEIQICKTFLTRKKEAACGFVLFSTTQESCFLVTLAIPNVILTCKGRRHKANKLKLECAINWGIYWFVTYKIGSLRVDVERGSMARGIVLHILLYCIILQQMCCV